jgi:hypothetical protein
MQSLCALLPNQRLRSKHVYVRDDDAHRVITILSEFSYGALLVFAYSCAVCIAPAEAPFV